MMKYLLAAVVLLGAATAPAQEVRDGLGKTSRPPARINNSPVTAAEAREALLRAEGVLRKSLLLSGKPTSSVPSVPKPITRSTVVAEFNRIYRLVKPKAKLTPRPSSYVASRLKISPDQRANLEAMVRLGAVAPYGPLATGPAETLTVAEFGDALGFFMSRLAEITHLPSNRWTPSLQDGG